MVSARTQPGLTSAPRSSAEPLPGIDETLNPHVRGRPVAKKTARHDQQQQRLCTIGFRWVVPEAGSSMGGHQLCLDGAEPRDERGQADVVAGGGGGGETGGVQSAGVSDVRVPKASWAPGRGRQATVALCARVRQAQLRPARARRSCLKTSVRLCGVFS
ncbi:fidgetin-like protein [Lates japonicus]|uniref:Fidgetin-like protein n=1 Tax=Lates japonicus TaxID=270547 RepID=A0AAD3NGS0_LATJO|nr:fidgetin-like protein [Lates japonicus]